MAKNRKNQSAAVRFGDLIKTVLLCAMIGGAGVGFVWQKGKIGELGRQISQREKRLVELSQQNEKMRKQLGLMRSPQFLEMRVKELNLGLVQPSSAQFWRVREPLLELPASTVDRLSARPVGPQALR